MYFDNPLILDAIGSNAVLTDGKVSIKPHYWVTPIAKYLQEKQEMVRTGEKQIKKQAEIEQWCGYRESDPGLILGKDT